jgi:hypothetical protein
VAWVGVGAGVAWFALGPREVYVPSYPVSRRYVNNINVSNTTVNTTVINNVYNTTIINNRTVNVTNVNYVNRNVPGAVAATTSQAFTTAQPVARNVVHVDERAIVSAPVRAVTPAEVPTKQAVLGGGPLAAARPTEMVQTRTVVARVMPPAPPPAFERRQEAIRLNGGKPLSVGAVRSIPTSQPPISATVRIAPPATPVVQPPTRPGFSPSARADREPVRPPSATSDFTRPAALAVHPQEPPQVLRPASPSTANSALERQYLQEQQQLHAQQEAERQRVQQQQERDHAQQARQQIEETRRQQLEQQRQQQTQQLAQQRAQEFQQQARLRAEEARRQQLEQQHQQQTQQLAQQHAQEFQQQARLQVEEARRQQLEQQHQQQTQQLAQQHAQAQQQQLEMQQEQRRQLDAQAQSRRQREVRPSNGQQP